MIWPGGREGVATTSRRVAVRAQPPGLISSKYVTYPQIQCEALRLAANQTTRQEIHASGQLVYTSMRNAHAHLYREPSPSTSQQRKNIKMSDKTTAVEKPKPDVAVVEYVPFGSQDKIKMNIGIVQNLIAVRSKLGKTCSDRDALKFMAMCQAKHLNPFEGDAFLIGYDNRDGTASFSLVTAHQTYLKRAELHPEFDGMKSGLIIEDVNGDLKDLEGDFYRKGETVVGGWATVYFKTRKQPMHKRLRLERFQKPYGIWTEDAAGMICKCAEADALRSSFPTMLGGLYLREELEVNTTVELAKPVFERAKDATKPLLFDVKPEPAPKPEPEPPNQGQDEPPPVEAEPAKKSVKYHPLKALKNLVKMAGITEGQLLDYMSATGAVDGSSATLEEQFLATPDVIDHSAQHWPELIEKIKEQLKKAEMV